MFVTSMWWRKPTTMDITVNEYSLHKILSTSDEQLSYCTKRKLLCKSNYHFFDDTEEDLLTKCLLTIRDNNNVLCFQKIYSQIDNINRRFFTNQ